MANYNCKRGWIIDMQEDGSYLPFFLYVRENEFIWKDIPDTIKAKVLSANPSSYSEFVPHKTFRATVGNWTVDVNEDGKCTMTALLKFSDTSNAFQRSSDRHMLKSTLHLPVHLKLNTVIAQATVNPVNDELLGSTANVTFNSTSSTVTAVNIFVVNSYLKLDSYNESGVFITINGELA